MNDSVNNIFQDIPEKLKEELIEVLIETKGIRIERIVSMRHASPPGYWYDQDKDEYVILLKGSAGILFEGKDDVTVMGPGDHVNIPAHVRHRVEWTDASEETVWLAVFY